MFKEFFSLQYNNRQTVIILFLFVFQMLGLRLFSGFGFFLNIIIFCLLFKNTKLNNKKRVGILLLSLSASIFQLLKGSTILYSVLVAMYVANAILLIYYSENHEIRNNFKAALKIFVIQAFLSVIVYILVPKGLFVNVNWTDKILQDKTFLYLFYYITNPKAFIPIINIPRTSGWAWEPGCLQLLVNLYICLEIFDKANIKKLVIPSVVLFTTASTSGFIVWGVNMLLLVLLSNARKLISLIPVFFIIMVSILPFMIDNVINKLSIGTDTVNTSGAIRMRDFYTGIETIKEYPLFGIDTSDLANSPQYQSLEDAGLDKIANISSTWHDYFDYAAGGYCNGFFTIHMLWGALGLFFLYWFLTCRLWKRWSYGRYWFFFPLIISLSLVSEPISNTALFMFFCLYNKINNSLVSTKRTKKSSLKI